MYPLFIVHILLSDWVQKRAHWLPRPWSHIICANDLDINFKNNRVVFMYVVLNTPAQIFCKQLSIKAYKSANRKFRYSVLNYSFEEHSIYINNMDLH